MQNEQLYQLLFQLMPSSVLLMDERGRVLDANPAFCRQIGYARGELVGSHVCKFSKDPLEAVERNIARLLAGEFLEHEVTNIQKDGTQRHYELRESAITLPDGSRGILALSNDITERLRNQRDRLELERQLLHADKLKSLGILAGGIAHDFNNLLAAITGNIELATQDLPLESSARTNLHQAIMAAARAADLTRQMLAYSGRGRFVVGAVNLSELVQGMTELLNSAISKKASLHLSLAEPLPAVEGDAAQLQQIVMNLITNSSDALDGKPGLISVTTSMRECDAAYLAAARIMDELPAGRYVLLEVRDTGCGMNAAARKQLFDPFFTTKFTGRGLGMSAVLGVVRGHNGGIMVASEPGQGTCISVLFPARDVRDAVPAAPPVPAPPAAVTTPTILTGTVLVVDDEAPIRLVMEQILRRTGLRVLTAADGHEAIATFLANADRITFVILDFTMPKLDGAKTLVELRRIRPDVKAVLTSGYDVETINHRYLQDGFAAFIRKPFQVETLLKLARQICAP